MVEIQKILSFPVNKLKTADYFLSKAFQNDPVFSYIIPDTRERLKTLNYFFQHVIKYGLRYG